MGIDCGKLNHPFYEDMVIRDRTYAIYQLYSSHELSSVHRHLSSLSIDYIVLEANYCYSRSGKCRLNDIWKVEDFRRLGRNHYRQQESQQSETLICDRLFAHPKPFFRRHKLWSIVALVERNVNPWKRSMHAMLRLRDREDEDIGSEPLVMTSATLSQSLFSGSLNLNPNLQYLCFT
ncbi:unnamed protein product [Medioppia subpectinata]|uniref:Uncharacterized protein n=1 Tax=Medioppia subpectinata TaxID=1979941 RepID=A0A7R9KYZ0_9ACAR|nr:unnamed protein product [Medioppia subpectinata]CAG2112478.1 unnamed protein product [Medioppia subpectinata]